MQGVLKLALLAIVQVLYDLARGICTAPLVAVDCSLLNLRQWGKPSLSFGISHLYADPTAGSFFRNHAINPLQRVDPQM